MVRKWHGATRIKKYKAINAAVSQNSAAYECSANEGTNSTIYKFDHHVMGRESIELSTTEINIAGIDPAIDLNLSNRYEDMCD